MKYYRKIWKGPLVGSFHILGKVDICLEIRAEKGINNNNVVTLDVERR